jgi:hypothetical protein
MNPWTPDEVCETHEWRSALGDTIRFVTRVEAQQRMMPPVAITSLPVPQAQGARFRAARHLERLVTLPVVVPGPQAGRDELRRWAAALDPLKGEGTLTVIQGDWAGRQLVCVYEAGLDEYAEDEPLLGLTTLAFHASEPYWRDATESSLDATINTTDYTWFPFAGSWAQNPLRLGASDIFAAVTITNTGDVDTWPVLSILGPGQELNVTNETTGLHWQITGTIAAGSIVEVDTRPGHKTVRIDGTNAFSRLTADSVLWPLKPGPNRIAIGFAAATEGSDVSFTWRNRWLAA